MAGKSPWVHGLKDEFDIIYSAMEEKKIKKIYNEVKSLNPSTLSKVRDKLIPIFLDLEKFEPFKDRKVIKLLKKRYELAIREHKQGKLINAEPYLRKSIG
jgi:hypothetical protein